MKFEEITGGAQNVQLFVKETGEHKGRVGDAFPSLSNMRSWGCRHGGYTWIIAYEPGLDKWSEEEKKKWTGYSASYRKVGQQGEENTIRVEEGKIYDTYVKAEEACKRTWRGIRRPN